MTLSEFQKEHPDLYAEAFRAGKEAGVSDERARVSSLEKWLAADAGNAKVAQIVAEAKATGKVEADVMPQLQVAVRDGAPASTDGDNPPAVRTQAASATAVEPEAVRMGAKMGVTAADIAADIAKHSQGGK